MGKAAIRSASSSRPGSLISATVAPFRPAPRGVHSFWRPGDSAAPRSERLARPTRVALYSGEVNQGEPYVGAFMDRGSPPLASPFGAITGLQRLSKLRVSLMDTIAA